GWDVGVAGTLLDGRARWVGLPHRLLVAGAGDRPIESCAGLVVEVRGGAEGLEKDRSGVSMKKLIVVMVALSAIAAEKPRVSAGSGTLIIGSYPKQFWIIDEATEKIVGTIPFQSGIPRRTTLSRDRKRFYTIEAAMEKIEIVDIATRKTVDSFTLSEGNKKVRIRSVEPDPAQRFVMMVIAPATKLIDRFEIGAPTLVQYDLKEHKIIRTVRWPNGEERQFANIQCSPDGKPMYLFTDQDVLIYETAGFTQVDKWELS